MNAKNDHHDTSKAFQAGKEDGRFDGFDVSEMLDCKCNECLIAYTRGLAEGADEACIEAKIAPPSQSKYIVTFEAVLSRWQQALQANQGAFELPAGLKGAMIGILNDACGCDANRKQFLKAVAGASSTKIFTKAEWATLKQMIKPDKYENVPWFSGNKNFRSVVNAVMAHIANNPDQYPLFESLKEGEK